MAAIRTGLSIDAQGYNLFVSGLMGSGRTAVGLWLAAHFGFDPDDVV